ncbi:hypothetical protein TWF481_011589 [Arthrobotrys musiformis]|uniref:F-box domain-containing protein n=1 Tax=Arthrobotrys musiformis TaxID=47236 RepID=A0AAV9VYQ8_9PEZI
MARLQTVPKEIHLRIAGLLLPRDVASLALTCQILKETLGHGNQLFWFTWLHNGSPGESEPDPEDDNPDPDFIDPGLEFKDFQPENKDYWAEAQKIIFGNSERGCSVCLATAVMGGPLEYVYFAYFPVPRPGVEVSDEDGRLKRRYCTQCFWQWHIELETFKSIYPDIPLPPLVGILIPDDPEQLYATADSDAAKLKRVIPITVAIKAIQSFYGGDIPFEIANSPSHRFKTRWSRTRSEQEVQLVAGALEFIKEIYTSKYKHLHVILSPEAYYKKFSDSLIQYILLDNTHRGTHNTIYSHAPSDYAIPPLSVAEDVMKIARLHTKGPKEQERALELANNIHTLLFCDPNNFQPQTLEYPYYMVIKTEMQRSCFGTAFLPVGVFTWHILYTYLYFDLTPHQKRCVRCYWCLRQKGGKDTDDNRYTADDEGDDNISDRWIAAHILMHHQDLVWKRPKNKVHDHCTIIGSHQEVYMLYWDGPTYYDEDSVEPFKEHGPDFENEELEDLPEEVIRFRGNRISGSHYFHWA